jgi:guanine deaminase
MNPKRTVYIGPFVHSESLQDLDICQNGVIGVDELGKIAFIERAGNDSVDAAEKHGWDSYDVVRITDNGFFFPGFVGKAYHEFINFQRSTSSS